MKRAVGIAVFLAGMAAGAVLLCQGYGGQAWGADVPREQIKAAIEQGVKQILATQKPDGSFDLWPPYEKEYAVGTTALAVLALEYARPHVSGELTGKVSVAIKKGLSSIVQQKPEEFTYSGGLATVAMFKENRDAYSRYIGTYAAMLAISQREEGVGLGRWGYQLRMAPGAPVKKNSAGRDWSCSDNSNTQLALLGLYYAERAGYQVPKVIWRRSAAHYKATQYKSGGWGYSEWEQPEPTANMTIAGTISLYLCEEMLRSSEHKQCVTPARMKEVDAGLKWIAENWGSRRIGSDAYGLYALERLGIIMGRANIGGHDWFNEGAATLLSMKTWSGTYNLGETGTAFGVMFLSQGLEPIIFNKLERRDTMDWDNDPYDIKHVTEFIQDSFQAPVQWRIVTLEAPLAVIQRAPMLFISGHKALDFNNEEKEKLKAYVAGGGTIIGEACCSKKEFDESFRALVKELFGTELRPIEKTHRIYERMKMKGSAPQPELEFARLGEGQGRPVVIYMPHDVSCQWQTGGTGARTSMAVGSGIYFYVTVDVKKMIEAEKEGAREKAEEPAK